MAWEWKGERGLVRDRTELEPARRSAVAYRETHQSTGWSSISEKILRERPRLRCDVARPELWWVGLRLKRQSRRKKETVSISRSTLAVPHAMATARAEEGA